MSTGVLGEGDWLVCADKGLAAGRTEEAIMLLGLKEYLTMVIVKTNVIYFVVGTNYQKWMLSFQNIVCVCASGFFHIHRPTFSAKSPLGSLRHLVHLLGCAWTNIQQDWSIIQQFYIKFLPPSGIATPEPWSYTSFWPIQTPNIVLPILFGHDICTFSV